jgi:hypothetical protein
MRSELTVKDRRFRLTTFQQCFLGNEAFGLIMRRYDKTEYEAKEIGNQLMCIGVFEHVCGEHTFKNERLFYRLRDRVDITAAPVVLPSLEEVAEIMRQGLEVKDRRYHFTVFKQCFFGHEAFALLQNEFKVTETQARELGNKLMHRGVFSHVCGAHTFKNRPLFYEFHLFNALHIHGGNSIGTSNMNNFKMAVSSTSGGTHGGMTSSNVMALGAGTGRRGSIDDQSLMSDKSSIMPLTEMAAMGARGRRRSVDSNASFGSNASNKSNPSNPSGNTSGSMPSSIPSSISTPNTVNESMSSRLVVRVLLL